MATAADQRGWLTSDGGWDIVTIVLGRTLDPAVMTTQAEK
jgi:hypothetical protein